MGWRPRTAEHPALEICCGSKNLYCMVLKINGVGKLRQEEYLHRLRFQLLWKTGIHIWLLWDKRKAGSMRDFLTVRGLLNGKDCRGLAAQEKGQVNKIVQVHSAQQVGNFSGTSGPPSPWLATQL